MSAAGFDTETKEHRATSDIIKQQKVYLSTVVAKMIRTLVFSPAKKMVLSQLTQRMVTPNVDLI